MNNDKIIDFIKYCEYCYGVCDFLIDEEYESLILMANKTHPSYTYPTRLLLFTRHCFEYYTNDDYIYETGKEIFKYALGLRDKQKKEANYKNIMEYLNNTEYLITDLR